MRIFFVIKLKSAIRIILFTVAAIICIGVLLATILNLQAVDVFKTAGKDLPIYYVDTQEKKVAITFDCAWGDGDIPQILDTLKKENVGATFFLVGRWAEKFPETVKMIAGAGHDVANHGYSHLRMGALDSGSINKELTLCSQKLAEITGAKVELFRPPYGDYSNNVVLAAKKQGLYTIQWDVDSLDWKPGISREEIIARVMKKVKNGSIILFHNDTPHTANVLPAIISSLKNQGYTIVPVSKIIFKENYYMDFDGKQKRKN